MPRAQVERIPPGDSSSRSLVERLKAHDGEAWRRLTDLYGPLVFGWARRAGLQESDSADVLQEVFRAVLKSIDAFRRDRPGDSFRGWLWTIARNKVHDHYRAARARPDAAGGNAAFQRWQDLPETPPQEQLHDDSREVARRALALLRTDFEESTFRAFWLTTVDGLPANEAARELGISVAAVYTAKSRVLARLRHELAGLGEC
jgi:RNA polymerase sigma-70 factor (ECF subfamily)